MEKLRLGEIKILLYRILLVYIFYQISRFSFWFFNRDLIKIDDIWVYLKLSYYGIAFDTTAILYTNSLFILLSIISATVNTTKIYQKILFWIYFLTNGIAYLVNFGDIVYFRFSQTRLTFAVFNVVENEYNLSKVLLSALGKFYSLFFICFVACFLNISLSKSSNFR